MEQPSLPQITPYVNRYLFSDHYLEEVLRGHESWEVAEDELKLAMQEAKNLYVGREQEWSRSNEAQLEQKLVRPMLKKLDHCFEVQPSLPTPDSVSRPDYAFFETDEERRRAKKEHEGEVEYFDRAIAIGDAKRWDRPLDKGERGSRDRFDRLSPSWQIDYYLRMSGVKWAILTNGRLWRLYSRDTSFRLDISYEIDVPRLLAEQDLEAFKYFFLFFRRQAFVPDAEGLCFLDRVYQGSLEYAQAVGDDLKENVYKALRLLAEGFLHTRDNSLDPERDLEEIHANSLVLLYRLLFINYAEDRRLLPRDNRLYKESYGLVSMEGEIASKLQRRESLPPLQATYWEKLRTLFDLINQGTEALGIGAERMVVPPYNGGLFDPEKHRFLEQYKVEDRWLAQVIDLLGRSQGEEAGGGFVDYSNLDVRHLGSIYEGLLEYKLRVADEEMVAVKRRGKEQWIPATEAGSSCVLEHIHPGSVYLATDRGERKATGSYYTPDYIVKYIVEHTVGPLIEEKMQEDDPIEGILSLKVLDPAMGSGHFLVEATDRLAHALVEALGAAEEEPEEQDIRWARREVVERCMYGVDLNPLAVELAKLSLWLHTVAEGKPLNFLDHHLKVGNSLIGAWVDDLGSLPVPAKKGAAKDAKPDVRQMNLFETRLDERLPAMLSRVLQIIRRRSDTLEDIKAKTAADEAVEALKVPFKAIADLWVSTYFGNELKQAEYQEALERVGEPDLLMSLPSLRLAGQIAEQQHLFHWELEFPEVFYKESARRKNPGFDAVVGNPPYDELSEQAIGRPIVELDFYRASQLFAPAAVYRVNVYRLFVVLALKLLRRAGRHGFIVPMSLLADRFTRSLREHLLENYQFRAVEVFPQKDDPRHRVFRDAKLSTCVYVLSPGEPRTKFEVRTHPGREIAVVSAAYSATAEQIAALDPDNLSIPGVDRSSWELLMKLSDGALFLRLGEIARALPGELMITKSFDPTLLVGPERGAEIVRGANIAPYEYVPEPKQGENWFLDSDRYLATQQPDSKAYHHRTARLVYQRTAAIDNYRRLIAAVIPAGKFCLGTASYLENPKYDLYMLLTLFNADVLEWRFSVTSSNNYVNGYEVEALPVPRIEFRTSDHRRRESAARGRQLCGLAVSDGPAPVLGFVDHHLGQGENDVVHDLLAHLGVQMIEMNKEKQVEAAALLGWLAEYTALPIEDWRLKTVVRAYWEHPWDELRRALRQNRKAIKEASGRDVESRETQEAIQREFEKSMGKLDPLLERIASTDRLIDQIVYRLYGLTEEEIAIVEGSV
jgi:hypothetical protein